jgi:cell division protein ZapE
MILSRLFAQLFERGAVLIATSNVVPDELYRDGLNRQLFLPFVDLLKRHVAVVSLDARTDYRLEKLERLPVYVHPLDERAEGVIERGWAELVAGAKAQPETIAHRGRSIAVPAAANGVARFTFDGLCRQPLGASDYGAIANRYRAVVIEGVPVMSKATRNEAKRFIMLIDTLYDAKTKAIVSAAAAPDQLYRGEDGTEAFEFERTASRLIEMQSSDYLKESEAAYAGGSRKTA